jgi:acyl carrier protein
MKTQEEIFSTLKQILEDMFEIEAGAVTPEASLNRDLDIDSIDAVDLMVKLRTVTGRRIQPEDFKNARTVQDVVDTLYRMYNG